ncbi:hypothetical protein EDD36DRAFT_225641 [Exophiala viscosa]|uniref:Uncharacterized protein n=1 Tax=Exophiala viscosa TaxID=2486360 RepID=A0AAN6IGC8_9EURO|nr:hypothetical protein EDD36DRAFT_225641 [Exophiala viscosa]
MSEFNDGGMDQTSSTASMATLVDYLKTGFRQRGPVSVPDDIKQLYRPSFQPTESHDLRDLQKILEDGRPKNILRLVPSSLCSVISIVLYYPNSQAQSKLLYLFMETVRQYKNETVFGNLMARVQTEPVTAESIRERSQYVSKKLAACVLHHLTNDGKDIQLRWRAAQFLSVILQDNPAAGEVVMQSQEFHRLHSILEADQSHVLRVLVADIVRELLHNGAERATLKSSPGSQRIIDEFPVAKEADSVWLSRAVEHLSDTDVGRAFSEQTGRIFRVQRLQCGDSASFQYSSAFIATIVNDITFLIPNGASMLTLLSIPLTSDLSITSVASESETSFSSIVEVQYLENNGYRITNGNKSAIDSITITFCDEESADSFRRLSEERKSTNDKHGSDALPEAGQKVSKVPSKRSVAVLDMSQTSDDEDHSGEQRPSQRDGHSGAGPDNEHVDTESIPRPIVGNKNGNGRLAEAALSTSLTSHLPPATTSTNQNLHPANSDHYHKPQQAKPRVPSPKPSLTVSEEPVSRSTPASADQARLFPDLKNSTRNHDKKKKQTFSISTNMAPLDDARSNQPAQTPTPAPDLAVLKKRPLSKAAAENAQSSEYDLPTGDQEPTQPNKRAKTKASKEPAKKTAAAESQMRSTKAVVTEKSVPRKSKGKQNTTKSPDKESQKTAASTRARRSAKSQTFVAHSDDSSDDRARKRPPAQASLEEPSQADAHGEHAEDSYPLEKNAAEAAIQSAKLSFTSNLKTLVAKEAAEKPGVAHKAISGNSDRRTTTPQRAIKPLSEGSIPSVSEKVLRKPSLVHFELRGPGNQATPPVVSATKVTQRSTAGVSADAEVSTSKALSGSADAQMTGPNVSEMHDGLVDNDRVMTSGKNVTVLMHGDQDETNAEVQDPEGDYMAPQEDQADSVVGVTSGRHFTHLEFQTEGNLEAGAAESKKTSMADNPPQGDAESADGEEPDLVIQEVRLESNVDSGIASVIDPVHAEHAERANSRSTAKGECLERADSPMQRSEKSDEETDERPSPVRSRSSMEQEVSEYIQSESSDDAMEMNVVSAEHPSSTRRRSPMPQTPALDDIPPVDTMTRKKESIRYQDHNRRSIGISTILDQEYPQAERVINTHKIRSSLHSGLEDVSIQVEPQRAARGQRDGMAALATATITTKVQGFEPVRQKGTSTSFERGNSMGPPPSRSTLSKPQHPARGVSLKTNLHPSATEKNSNKVVQDPAPLQHNHSSEEPKPTPPVPVRIKKAAIPLAPLAAFAAEAPPGTPLSFCTRWDMEARNAAVDATDGETHVPNNKDVPHKSGDTSLTLINGDESVDAQRSAPWPRRRRRLRSISTDDMSSVVSPSRGEAFTADRKQATTDLKVRDSQRGLLDAVMEITKDVLFRFGEEEDAIKTKVDELYRGGDQIVQTLTDSWNERLAHEHRNMTQKFAEEKNSLTEACELFKEQNTDSWQGVLRRTDVKTSVEQTLNKLTAKIEALRSRQKGI